MYLYLRETYVHTFSPSSGKFSRVGGGFSGAFYLIAAYSEFLKVGLCRVSLLWFVLFNTFAYFPCFDATERLTPDFLPFYTIRVFLAHSFLEIYISTPFLREHDVLV